MAGFGELGRPQQFYYMEKYYRIFVYLTKASNGISMIQNFQNGLDKTLNRMIDNLSVPVRC